MIRVRWERAGHFKAVSMDLRDRMEASSTSSALAAVLACAGKAMECAAAEVSILTPRRPSKPIEEVATTTVFGLWHAFECVRKGTASQLDLLPGGAS